ncbi:hypothetical protein RJ55_02266 [Drechmeria coniospora]|nr:hypothetical protein RJ55_02266 [Drechmeria coniospora]
MTLFATGFNAWRQLDFDCETQPDSREPDDKFSFTNVLEGGVIERPVSRLQYTLVQRDNVLCKAGFGLANQVDQEAAYAYAETANGEILAIEPEVTCPTSDDHGPPPPTTNVLVQYASAAKLKRGERRKTWRCVHPAKAIAAFDAGFVILYQDGTVATMGDARFEDCLGRDCTERSPPEDPGIVHDLANLGDPVVRIAAGGHSLAALTESGGTYLWGMMSPSGAHRQQAFPSLTGIPNYVEFDDGKDIVDFALGDSHAIALTMDGCVLVIGDNTNGQLGFDGQARRRIDSWTTATVRVPHGHEVVAVAAGPKSSFVLTSSVHARGDRTRRDAAE